MAISQSVKSFYKYSRLAVIDSLKIIRNWESERNYFLRHYKFPEINFLETGLPIFYLQPAILGNSPIDYNYPFNTRSENQVSLPESWNDLWNFVKKDPRFSAYFEVDRFEKNKIFNDVSFSKFEVQYQLKMLVDHYIHTTGLKHFKKQKFIPIFIKWANACYRKKLNVDFLIPIIILDFEIEDNFKLSDFVSIEKMTKEFQLIRAPRSESSISINKSLSGAATHAVVFSNWSYENNTCTERQTSTNNIDSLSQVIQLIDKFFSALRVVTGYNTGYSQIITRPVGWCDIWTANLEKYPKINTKGYGDALETISWKTNIREVVTKNQLNKLSIIFKGLDIISSNRMKIASNRLNAAYMRKEETDTIIDICIGLEALLVGDERGEITHKLASRLGLIWQLSPGLELSPFEAFKAVKKIYDYRSAVVHGSKKAEKKRLIKPRPATEIQAVNLGINILRHAIGILIQNQKYLEEGEIDKSIFTSTSSEYNT